MCYPYDIVVGTLRSIHEAEVFCLMTVRRWARSSQMYIDGGACLLECTMYEV